MLFLFALSAPAPRQHVMLPGVKPFMHCISTSVEMKTQVCTNVCNNKEKFACPAACRCTPAGKSLVPPKPITSEVYSRIWTTATSFHRLGSQKKAARKKATESVAKLDGTIGYYAPSWGMGSIGMDDATVGVAFSGWNTVQTALEESSGIELRGSQYLSLGGSSEQGTFDPSTVAQMGEDCPQIKEAGYAGVCFDVEVTRGGKALIKALEETYAKCKKAGLVVMVTTSHSAPTGVSLGDIRVQLINSWVKSPDVDIISPQLYTWGGEDIPDFNVTWPCDNCTWNLYKGSKGKFMPSLVDGTHLKATKDWFKKENIEVAGYFQWKPVLTPEDQAKADAAAKAQEEYEKAQAEKEALEGADQQQAPQQQQQQEEEDPGPSPIELAIQDDLEKGWITKEEAKAAQAEYEEMHEKGWAFLYQTAPSF
jgi:hypothetical protein